MGSVIQITSSRQRKEKRLRSGKRFVEKRGRRVAHSGLHEEEGRKRELKNSISKRKTISGGKYRA